MSTKLDATTIEANDRWSFETAAQHATRDVPVVHPGQRIEEVRNSLFGRRYESTSHIVVCEDGVFRGVLTIEDALSAAGDAVVGTLMDAGAPMVGPGVDQEVAAWRAVSHHESALSVVAGDGRFIGVIPPHRLIAVLLAEHEEDLTRLGGFLRDTSAARQSSEEPARRRFWHRIPWLLLGLAGALTAADLVGWFGIQLESNILLAFFIPSVCSLWRDS